MKQLLFVCHLLQSYVFQSAFSDSSASLFYLIHLFWRVNQLKLKIAGVLRFTFYVLRFTFYVLRFTFVSFVSRTFLVVNESFLMFLDSSMEERCRSGLMTKQPAAQGKGRRRYGSALFLDARFVLKKLILLFFFDRRLSSFVFRLSSFVFRRRRRRRSH